MKITACRMCGAKSLERFINLGDQPNGNNFPTADEFAGEHSFPFAMDVCTDCWEVQLEESPTMEFMFSNHPYVTGVNMPVVAHFDRLVADTLRRFPLAKNSLVVDIGANDGTLLDKFRGAGMRVLGVDPGKRTGELAKKNGVSVCETFWNEETAGAIKHLNLKPDLITATAVFYHVEDIHSFVKGLAKVMHPNSIFLTQCVYLKDVIEKMQFDHFYHEHTMIHALAPLQRLFAKNGLRMLDVEHYDVHGGSFVLWVGREDSPYPTREAIQKTIDAERAAGLQKLETYHAFTKRVEQNRDDLVALLRDLRQQGKSVGFRVLPARVSGRVCRWHAMPVSTGVRRPGTRPRNRTRDRIFVGKGSLRRGDRIESSLASAHPPSGSSREDAIGVAVMAAARLPDLTGCGPRFTALLPSINRSELFTPAVSPGRRHRSAASRPSG